MSPVSAGGAAIPSDWIPDTDTDSDSDSDCDEEGRLQALLAYDYIWAVCMTGTSTVGHPDNLEMTVPAPPPYLAYPVYENYNGAADEWTIGIGHGTWGQPLLHDFQNGDGIIWDYTYDPDCADYDFEAASFWWQDGANFGWTGGSICEGQNGMPAPPPPMAAQGRVPSGEQACVAGEADFQMAVRRPLREDDEYATLWLVPVSTDAAPFPERAWLREIEVVDWGDATNIHYADFMERIKAVDGFELNGTQIEKPASGPTVVTFPVGKLPMSTMMGTSSLPVPDEPGETAALPELHLTWSCEMDKQNPHAIKIADRSGHAVTLGESNPIQNRIVFWVADDGEDVHVAPEGRYSDYSLSELAAYSGPGKTFRIDLPGYGRRSVFAGRLVPFNSSYKLEDGLVTIAGTDYTIPTKVLTPL